MSEESIEPRTHIRRRKTLGDKLIQMGAYAGAFGAIIVVLVPILGAFGRNPFVSSDAYAADKTTTEHRFNTIENKLSGLESNVNSIQRNGILTLQLQLKGLVAGYEAELRGLPAESSAAAHRREDRDRANQQLDEVTRQLNGMRAAP